MSEFSGTLDLSGSDPNAVGFPAIPSGLYQCHVAKAEWKQTENIDGSKKLPHGTPYLNLGIRVNEDEEPRNGQTVAGAYAGWAKLFVPPADYDPSASQRMKNAMANFLEAIGEDWRKKNYKMPDADSLVGKQVAAVVRKRPDSYSGGKDVNEIEGFKVAGSVDAPVGGLV